MSPLEGVDLVRAQVAIVMASWRLRRVRIGDLVTGSGEAAAGLNASQDQHSHATSALNPQGRAEELARAIGRASRYGVLRPACLVRSIALRNLLADAGVGGAVIRVGVRRDSTGFLAHAWVERDGVVIGDDANHVAGFTPLTALGVRTTR